MLIDKPPRDKLTEQDMLHANIPADYWRAGVDRVDYEGDEFGRYRDRIVPYMRRGVGLLLHGPKGHGKTYAACALLRVAIKHRARGFYLEVNRLQEVYIERSTTEFDVEEVSMLERARRAELLVLDDLGEEHVKEFSTRVLEGLCRYRLSRRRSTIFTTNLPVKGGELERIYGGWITSVLKGKVHPLRIQGTDWREKQARALEQELGR